MCFSASASFIAGTSLSIVGVATIRKAKKKSELPFAAFPLLFGVQQFIEGIVWYTFTYNMPLMHMVATYIYTIFAYVLWPIFVPFSIRLLETVQWRKIALSVLQIIGTVVGLYLLYFIVQFPVTSEVVRSSIVYDFSHPFGDLAFSFYFIAVIFSCFFSRHKIINLFGILVALSFIATYYFYSTYVVSIWCFFAAILSGIIYLYFVSKNSKML